MTQDTAEVSGKRIQLKQILAPTDFSPLGDYAVEMAGEFARRYQAKLTILHVMAPYFGGTEADVLAIPAAYYGRDLMAMLQERLDDLAARLREQGTDVSTLISMGTPFFEIVRTAKAGQTDLIIISTHGRTGLSHAFLGSTAERVVRKAPCPVLSVRPKKTEDYPKAEG